MSTLQQGSRDVNLIQERASGKPVCHSDPDLSGEESGDPSLAYSTGSDNGLFLPLRSPPLDVEPVALIHGNLGLPAQFSPGL